GGVGDEGGFDFGGGDVVAGDEHDVVDAAEEPVVAVGVAFGAVAGEVVAGEAGPDRKSTRLNSSHVKISYGVLRLKKKKPAALEVGVSSRYEVPATTDVYTLSLHDALPIYGGVGDEGGFDFGGGDVVAGDEHDVVDAAEEPVVAVGVAFGAVAGEVVAGEAG